jgi:ABC-type Fe3+/spermidine/putrescine transport system ATPase subunit
MIEIKGLYLKNRGFSLNNISLKVPTGSCHALIGPTGCGKTTLLEAITGFRKSNQGQIFLDGKDVTLLPSHERGISYVPQDLALFPHLSVEENILYGIRHGRSPTKELDRAAALDLAASVGIGHLLQRKPDKLSGGERQRTALIRALASRNKYLLLDEPLSALHEGMKKDLWLLLHSLQRKYAFTTLMISHDMEETFFLADQVSIMTDGVIHQSGTGEEVCSRPATEQVAEFLGMKNIFHGERREGGTAFFPDLATNLSLGPESDRTQVFKAGIPPEHIRVLGQKQPELGQENILSGRIEDIFARRSTRLLFFRAEQAQGILEIEMLEQEFRLLGLEVGQSVSVHLPQEHFFFLH